MPARLKLLGVALLAVALAAVVTTYHVLSPTTDDRATLAVAEKHPGLRIREYADGSWSVSRAWSGHWEDVAPTTTRILVSAERYVPAIFDTSTHRGRSLPPLVSFGVLSVAVTGPGRALVVGESIDVIRQESGTIDADLATLEPAMALKRRAQTGENGTFEFELIPEVAYEVSLPSKSIAELGINHAVKEVVVRSGERKNVAFAPLTAADVLVGWIETATGESCANARVALRSKQDGGNVIVNQDLLVAHTGPNGVFFLEGKVPQPQVRIESRDTQVVQYFLWVEWKSHDGRTLRGCWPAHPWEGYCELGGLTLPKNVAVEVRVTQGGLPLPGAAVRVCIGSQLELSATTDGEGSATFDGLPAGLAGECLVESPDMMRAKADLASLMGEGGTIEVPVETPYLPSSKVGSAIVTFDRASHNIDAQKGIILKCAYYDPELGGKRSGVGGGWDIPGGSNSVEVPAGHCMIYAVVRSTKLVTEPQYLQFRNGETYEFKATFFEQATLYVETDVDPQVASVFAGVKTLDGLHIFGDFELTGGFTKRKGPFKYVLPPNGTYKLRLYAEPVGVPRGPRTRLWHEIELEPFEPGEVRSLKIAQWWSQEGE